MGNHNTSINSNQVKTINYYSVELVRDHNLATNLIKKNYSFKTNETQSNLVKRSKSYAIPENQVLPCEFIATKPLRKLNKFRTDGSKKTWKRCSDTLTKSIIDNDTRPNKNQLAAKSSLILPNCKRNDIIKSKSFENFNKTNVEVISKFPIDSKVYRHYISDNDKLKNSFDTAKSLKKKAKNDKELKYFETGISSNDNLSSESSSSIFSNAITNTTLLSYTNEAECAISYFNRNQQWETTIFQEKKPTDCFKGIKTENRFLNNNKLEFNSHLSFTNEKERLNEDSNFILKPRQESIVALTKQDYLTAKIKKSKPQSFMKSSRKCIDEVFPINLKSGAFNHNQLVTNRMQSLNWLFGSLNSNDLSKRSNCSSSSNEYEALNNVQIIDYPLEKLNILY